MRKYIVRLVCCFIPSSKARHYIRHKYTKKRGVVKNPKQCKNNRIVVVSPDGTHRQVRTYPDVNIRFQGDNNYIELHEPLDNLKLCARLMSNAEIIIHSTHHPVNLHIVQNRICPDKSKLIIGSGLSVEKELYIEMRCANITIGKDCMFSWGVSIRNTDYHVITNKDTHDIINPDKDIIIGDHVWIGSDVKVLKGAVISNNSVVGTNSVVTGKFDEQNIIIAGVPARIIKRDIDWDRRDTYTYECENKK